MALVSELLDDLMRSLGHRDRHKLLVEIEAWAKTSAREGHVGADTYDNYRSDADTEAQLGATLLFLEYLVAHRWSNAGAAKKLHEKCAAIIGKKRRQRFVRPAPHEETSNAEVIARHSGVYALIRMESQYAKPCQEVLILRPAEKSERVRLATVIGRNIIMRGTWHLLGLSVHITGTGYRPGHHPDAMTISFLQTELGTDLSAGVLTGLTTQQREPVTMSAILHRLSYHPSILSLGDLCDGEIVSRFASSIPKHLNKRQMQLFLEVELEVSGKNENPRGSWFDQNVIDVTNRFVASLRSRDDFKRIMLPELSKLCREDWE